MAKKAFMDYTYYLWYYYCYCYYYDYNLVVELPVKIVY